MDARQRSRAIELRGITLIELLLVLAILALVAASAWPSLERSMADQRLRDAADVVRAEWQHARTKAMDSGVAHRFCYTPDDRTYWIEACEETDVASGGASSSAASPAAQADRMQLPEHVTFAEGKIGEPSSDSASEDQTPAAQDAASTPVGSSEANAPIVFSADGTCSPAEVTLRNEHGRVITVTIHGLTGIAVVGEIADAPEASP